MRLDGYSNYEIYPDTGQVFSYKTNRFLKGFKDTKGYQRIRLLNDNNNEQQWKVHRLIWTVVNGEIPDGMQINHLDERKDNNCISNLNLMTPKENVNWGTRNKRAAKGISKALKGREFTEEHKENISKAKGKSVCMFKNNKIVGIFQSTRAAEKQINGSHSLIGCCCNGSQSQHKGYQWRYLEDQLADWLEEIQDEDMKNERVA